MGFSEEAVGQLPDRLVDALVARGDVAALRERLDRIGAQLDTLLARAAPPPTS